MTDEKEVRYLKRIMALNRAYGLLFGLLEGTRLHLPDWLQVRVVNVMDEANSMVEETKQESA